MSTTIDVNVNNIFFASSAVDPASGHPVYVFDSTYLPSFDAIDDQQVYDLLVDKLMDRVVVRLPSSPYSLVVFSSGFTSNDISWVYGIKMYSKLPKQNRINLQKIYIVHESFFIRTVYQVLKNVMNIGFLNSRDTSDTLVHVSTLSQLASYIDITTLRISLNVYLYNYQFEENIQIPAAYYEARPLLAHRQYRQVIFDKIFKRLKLEAPQNELVFQKPGSYKKINVLLDVIERNNYIDLSQWDVYSLASVFLHFVKNKSKPLFPIDLIPLPIGDGFEDTYNTFVSMMLFNGYYDLVAVLFPLFLTLLDNPDVTRHDYKSLSKCLTTTLCKEKVSIKSGDRLAVGNRYIRNVLVHFDRIVQRFRQTGAASPAERQPRLPARPAVLAPDLPRPRKSSPSKYPSACDTSPQRTAVSDSAPPPRLPKRGPAEQTGAAGLRNCIVPVLPPPKTLGLQTPNSSSSSLVDTPSLRIASNSSLTLVSDRDDDKDSNHSKSGADSGRALSSSTEVLLGDAITDRAQTPDEGILLPEGELAKLTLEQNEKIRTFDKDLKKKKLEDKGPAATKFSHQGYSDIKTGNKVSRLAALYEQRLQALQVMDDIKRTG